MDRTLKLPNTMGGGLKNPYSFTDSQCFLDIFYEIFFYSWGDDPIWCFSCLQWTQSFAFSEFYSNQPKSEIYQKMPMFEQLKKTSSSEPKKNFDPSLERSWYELFGIIKAHSPKNQPPSSRCNRSPPTMYFQKMQLLGVFRPFLQRSLIQAIAVHKLFS